MEQAMSVTDTVTVPAKCRRWHYVLAVVTSDPVTGFIDGPGSIRFYDADVAARTEEEALEFGALLFTTRNNEPFPLGIGECANDHVVEIPA